MSETDGRVLVRERNAVAILDAAADTLAVNPGAGMGEIATAAGVGRATLYRHYETREDLVAAIETRMRTAFQDLLEDLRAHPDHLESFLDALFRMRIPWASVIPRPQPDPSYIRAVWAPMLAVITDLQANGTINAALSPDWVLAAFRGLIRGAAEEIDAGRLEPSAATALVGSAFRRGVA
jgi:AcrR family transcriptional regulator